MARRPTYRPGIRLIILVLLIVGSYLYLGLAGATPRLGVDLAGGTTVTLEPRGLCDGKSVSNAQLDQAVNILRQRVNGFGVSEADVVRNGKFIVITVPGKDRNGVLSTVGQTAQLFFRQVVAAEPDPSYQDVAAELAKASASAAPSASASPSLPGPGLGSIEVSGSAKPSASASPAATSAAPSATSTAHGRPAPQLGLGPLAGPARAALVATSTPTPTAAATPTPAPTPTASASTSPADETAVQCAAEAANAAADSASPSPSVSASPSPSVSAPVSAPISPRVTPSATSTAHGRPLPFAAAASASAKPSASARASASAKPSPSPSASPTPSLTPEQQLDQPPAQCQGATGSKKTACDQWGNLHCGVVAEGRGTALPDAVEAVLRPSTGDTWALGCSRIGANPPDYKYLLAPAAPPCTKASTKDTPCGALGTDVKSGSVVANPKTTGTAQTQIVTNDWVVDLDFRNSHFAQLTRLTAGANQSGIAVAITLDGIVQSAPYNETEIDGPVEISTFTQKQAQDLANVLKFGALPISFGNAPQTQTISATLGHDSLNAGLLAGAIGLALVIIYCFIYYRALGFVTILSLAVSGSLVYATVVILGKAIGYTLSLAGIAGFIVAIGITADSFVVFYERLKDEVREGRTARSGVEAGWVRARRTILSADAVSLLAAVILYVVSIGSVRGFAFTLGVSTALDLVTVFLFTKPLVTMLVQRPFFSSGKWSGLTAAAPNAPIRRRPTTSRPLKPQGGEL